MSQRLGHGAVRRLRDLLALGALTLVVLAIPGVSGATAATGPTLILTEFCFGPPGQQFYGARVSLSGFPPNATFTGSLQLDGSGAGPGSFTTDANGNFAPTGFTNSGPVNLATAVVTYSGGQLTRTLAKPCQTTITTVVCSPSSVMAGQATTCTATVSDAPTSAQGTPGGTVDFGSSDAGSFGGGPCTLSGSGPSASCSVSYTPTAVGSGSHTVTASYGGDGLHNTSSGTTSVIVKPAVPTSKDQCKHDGWRNYPQFKNQGDCVSFVNNGK